MATTLSEILQAKGDADYSQGGEGGAITQPDYTSAVANQYLQHAADLTYNAHRYLAEQHDRNMQEELKGLNDVDFKDLLPQDSQALMPEYNGSLKDIANNFGVIRNPLSNPQQYAALKGRESGLRQKLSQAQQDALFIRKQNEFVQLHPEFNTPAYQQSVKTFLATPVGQRQPFVVTPPRAYDPVAAYKLVNELSKKKWANAGHGGGYLTEAEGETTDPNTFNGLSDVLPGYNQYGQSNETLRHEAYDNMPLNLKPATYELFKQQEKALYKNPDQTTKASIKNDELGAQGTIAAKGIQERKNISMEAGISKEAAELKFQRDLELAGLKGPGKDGKIDKDAMGAYINKTFHDMATSVPNTNNYNEKLNAINKNPNLAYSEKIKQMEALSNDPANYTDQAVPNEVLQPRYGDNTPLKQIQKSADNTNKSDGIVTSNESQNTIPTGQVISNKLSKDGQSVIIYRKNNLTGKISSQMVPLKTFYSDLTYSFGEKNAPIVQKAAKEWLQKHTGSVDPDVDKLHNIFAPNANGPAQIKSQEDYNALPKGAQYIDPTDGKPYIKQ